MNTVISGNFQRADHVEEALTALLAAGFSSGDIASFPFGIGLPKAVHSAPDSGEHDPMQALESESPGHDPAIGGALSGAAVGGAVGVAVGVATLPLLGPAAAVAGVGAAAYVGSLVGALSRLGDPAHPDQRDADAVADAPLKARQDGMLIAVQLDVPGRRDAAIDILRRAGARDLEATEGRIVDGQWIDFDRDAMLKPIAA